MLLSAATETRSSIGEGMEFKLYCMRVFVTDWERSIRFYTETLAHRVKGSLSLDA
jgi:hypothetical protein